MQRREFIGLLVLAAFVVGLQLAVHSLGRDFYLTQITMSVYYSVVVMGLCLVMGYAGQVSLGHGAFFALGGFTSAILTTLHVPAAMNSAWGATLLRLGLMAVRPGLYGGEVVTVTPWTAFVAGLVLTVGVALLIGYPALRLRGHYLAMATLGFGLIVYRILLGSEFTGGADGITGVPPWTLAPGLAVSGHSSVRISNYYVAWGFAILSLAMLLNLVNSRIGRAMRAIHGGETAANAMGINTSRLKLHAFVISAVLASAAGSLLTHYNGGIGPSEAGAMKSVRYVALVAAGGMANLWGGIIVSIVLTFLSLRGYFGSLDHAVFGGILIAIVSLAPQGPLRPLAALMRSWSARVTGRRAMPAPGAARAASR